LFLDFDGTLVEIASRPSDVYLSRERKQSLEALATTPGVYVAIVSGRLLDDLRHRVAAANVFYVGSHGWEWIGPDACVHRCGIATRVADALQDLHDHFSDRTAHLSGIILEYKNVALALHYRMASEQSAATVRSEFLTAIRKYQQRGVALEVLCGKGVTEAKAAGRNKADAVAHLLSRYAPGALPIYFGDDQTDESAFHRLDGSGITVLVAETPRPTSASFYIKSPDKLFEVLRLLIHNE
jgi:trehalose-phosphatase